MTNRIDQPRDYDVVGNPILVAGIGIGYEATLNYRVTEGHDERTGHFMVASKGPPRAGDGHPGALTDVRATPAGCRRRSHHGGSTHPTPSGPGMRPTRPSSNRARSIRIPSRPRF